MTKSFVKYYHALAKGVNKFLWSGQAVHSRPVYVKYGFAVILLFAATCLNLFFYSSIGEQTPFLLYFGVVILGTGFGGIGPGIFSALMSAIIARYYFMLPARHLAIDKHQAAQIFVFGLECLLIISLSIALTLSGKALRASADRFKLLIENINDAISVLDVNGKLLYISPSIERILGYSVEEFDNLTLRTIIHEEDLDGLSQQFISILTTPGKSFDHLCRMLHKNGQWKWIESTMTNLLEYPEVNGIVANFRNVTEKIILEKQKDDFISIATHELKTPVTSIKAYAQILLRTFNKEGNDPAAVMVNKMDGQINRLIGLIGDLLDVTKIEAGKLQLQEDYYEFKPLLTELVEELQLTTKNHKIVIKPFGEIKVYGDRDRVGQVITNLITNAIKYSPTCEDIIVTTSFINNNIQVCVKDCGVGISKENQAKLFERFYRVNDADNKTFPGLGLGLYISHEIIKRQRGKIWVESEKGKGSTFCFSLPIDYRMAVNQHINNNDGG